MNKIEMYLEKQNKIILEDREKNLIELGLTEKEYSPDGKESYKYPKYEYLNGEKKYYREVAIKVTDEEYVLLLSKAKQVEEIKTKEELERQKERNRASYKVIKKWIPVFEKAKSEGASLNEEDKEDNGKSKVATVLRVVAWIIGIVAVISGIATSCGTDSILPILSTLGIGAIEMLMFYALAAVLDYLAELTSIARNGYKYTEANK